MSTKILTVQNLTVRLKYGKILILDNVSFELFSGDVLCIDGLNGSGKSTLLKIICGQLADYVVESGEIIYHPFSNKSILNFNDEEMLLYHSKIGYVPQKDNYEGLNKINIEDLIDDVISIVNLNKSDAINLFEHYFKNNKRISLKSIPPMMIPKSGVRMLVFNAVMIAVKAEPTMRPTAMLTTSPLEINALNSSKNFFISYLLNIPYVFGVKHLISFQYNQFCKTCKEPGNIK